jgi:RimJ/RimL family protein N-acetyltransferase
LGLFARHIIIMSFTNSYKAEDPLPSEYYGPDPYDINWMLPLHEATLESDRVKLTPFIPSLHARPYADQAKAHPDLHHWYPYDLSTLNNILTEIETQVRRNPTAVIFAIIDKARGASGDSDSPGALAGVIALQSTFAINLTTEIGWLVVFPEFRRTYVTSNAVGLLLNHCLELPDPSESSPGRPRGLGFRRVQWTAQAGNKPSHAAAKRMGFKEEGVMRWTWVMPEGAEGDAIPRRDGDPLSSRAGRDNVIFSFCADDWENGGREHVQHMIGRQ